MRRPAMPRQFEHVQMTDQVRLGVDQRMIERIAHTRLGAEMDDSLEVEIGQRRRERRLIGEVDLDEAEAVAMLGFEERQAVPLQLDAIIIAETVDADDRRAALEQPLAQMKADE